MRILFYCNSDGKSGLGHFSRCLTTAIGISNAIPSSNIDFLGVHNEFVIKILKKHGFGCIDLTGRAGPVIDELISYAKSRDAIVIDSYDIDQNFIEQVCGQTCKTIFIDDFNDYDFNKADLIINFTINAINLGYKNKHLALGPDYFIVPEAIRNVRLHKISDEVGDINNLLVFLGGIDIDSAILSDCYRAIDSSFTGITISVINRLISIPELYNSSRDNRITMYPLSGEMSNHYNLCDAVISGGGLTKYEATYCGLPNAVISTNPGQQHETDIFCSRELCFSAGKLYEWDYDDVVSNLTRFSVDKAMRTNMRANGISTFKTDSMSRLVSCIKSLIYK